LLYAFALGLLTPYLLWRAWRTGRYRQNLRAKWRGVGPLGLPAKPSIWFHGVSVGEIHLLRGVVAAYRQRHPEYHVVISATTDTGMAEAHKHFPGCTIIAYPFDFTWAVRRTLRQVRPRVVVLAESELWPNFLHIAQRERVPVVVINGRMSPRTARRYQRIAGLARRVFFDRVRLFGMQSDAYAQHLRTLGLPPERVRVTGNVKYDGVVGAKANPTTQALRTLLGIQPDELIWLVGSTHAPEEALAVRIYRRLLPQFPTLRLIVVPRAPERFDDVADIIRHADFPIIRHRETTKPANLSGRPVVLIDSMGVLGHAWGLADIGFAGGSLNDQRGGQSMIEPAGYGVPVLFGPHTWNFKDAVAGLLACGGAGVVQNEAELERELVRLLHTPELRATMGAAGRAFVMAQQGATQRTLDLIDEATKD
jgi:3-deoxy-D-manno-octulosonic-acid transferase